VAALPKPLSWIDPALPIQVVKRPQQLEFSGVFRGHELTRKDRRLSSGLAPIDALLDGGIPRGRISEITGRAGSGKTSIAASFASFATQCGEVAAWLDASGSFDPESMAAAGVELRRMLWASMKTASSRILPHTRFAAGPLARPQSAIVKAAELVLEAGGFGLVVVDFGEAPRALSYASSLRIARAAERSGAAVIAMADVRDVRRPEHCRQPRRDVVQPARSRLTGDVRRTRGRCNGRAQQDGRDGAACSRARAG
jgi:recA bacterial DNA recombination protein